MVFFFWFSSKTLPARLHYLFAVNQSQAQMTTWRCIEIRPAQLQFDCGKHQRQRSRSSVRPSVSKSYDFFLDLKFCTNIIRGRIFLLSASVRLAAGVSSPVTKFGWKHQKDKKKRQKIISWHSFTHTLLLLLVWKVHLVSFSQAFNDSKRWL